MVVAIYGGLQHVSSPVNSQQHGKQTPAKVPPAAKIHAMQPQEVIPFFHPFISIQISYSSVIIQIPIIIMKEDNPIR